MVRIGDRITRVPVTFDRLDDKPQNRFHVVEFDTPGGRIRESFQGV